MPFMKKTIHWGLLLSFAFPALAGEQESASASKTPTYKASAADSLCARTVLDMDLSQPFYMVGLADVEFSPQHFAESQRSNQAQALKLQNELERLNKVDQGEIDNINRPSGLWIVGGFVDYFRNRTQAPVLKDQIAKRNEKLAVLDRVSAIFTRMRAIYPELTPGGRKPVRGWSEHFDDLVAEWLYRQAVQNYVALRELQVEIEDDETYNTAPILAALKQIEEGLNDLDAAVAAPGDRAAFTPVLTRFLRAGAHARLAQWNAHVQGMGRGSLTVAWKQFMPVALSSGVPLSVLDERFQGLRRYANQYLAHRALNDSDILAWLTSASADGNAKTLSELIPLTQKFERALASLKTDLVLESAGYILAMDLLIPGKFTPIDLATRLAQVHAEADKVPGARVPSSSALVILAQLSEKKSQTVQDTFQIYLSYALANNSQGEARFADDTVAAMSGLGPNGSSAQNLLDLRNLRSSIGWKKFSPKYSEQDWARLYLLARYFGIEIHTMADLGRRVFEIRGKVLEAGRLLSVLTLGLQTKYGYQPREFSRLSGSILSDDELKEFAIIPSVRLNLPLTNPQGMP
jgi:hypothetical protein